MNRTRNLLADFCLTTGLGFVLLPAWLHSYTAGLISVGAVMLYVAFALEVRR